MRFLQQIKKLKHPNLVALGLVLAYPVLWLLLVLDGFAIFMPIILVLVFAVPFVAALISTYSTGKYGFAFSLFIVFPLLTVISVYVLGQLGFRVDSYGLGGAVFMFIGVIFPLSIPVMVGMLLGKHWHEKRKPS